eukprot:PRCOL_00003395-RA
MGRKNPTARAPRVASGALAQCDGSAHAAVGALAAVAGVKADVVRPRASAPDCGSIAFSVEVSPCAREQWGAPRRREAEAATLRAALQSAFGGAPDGSGAAVDLARLCVARARHAWELRVHVAIMAAGDGAHNACGGLGGGMLACASAAVRAALSTAAIPRAVAVAAEGENGTGGAEVEVEIEDGEEVDPLVVASMPVVLTAALLDATPEGEGEGEGEGSGAVVVVDPTEAEEGCARATLSVAVLEGGQVCWERLSHDGAHAGVSGAEYAALRAAALGAAPAVAAAIDAQLLADEDNMDVV